MMFLNTILHRVAGPSDQAMVLSMKANKAKRPARCWCHLAEGRTVGEYGVQTTDNYIRPNKPFTQSGNYGIMWLSV